MALSKMSQHFRKDNPLTFVLSRKGRGGSTGFNERFLKETGKECKSRRLIS